MRDPAEHLRDNPNRLQATERLALAKDVIALQADLLELSRRLVAALAQLDREGRVELGVVLKGDWFDRARESNCVQAVEESRG